MNFYDKNSCETFLFLYSSDDARGGLENFISTYFSKKKMVKQEKGIK